MQNLSTQADQRQIFMDEEIIDLREYWRVVRTHQSKIIGLAVLFALVSILVVFSMTPIYKSTATLLIEPNANNVVSIEEVYGVASNDTDYYATQFAILESRILIEKVIDRLGLDQHPEFLPKKAGPVASIKMWFRGLLPQSESVSTVINDENKRAGLINNFRGRLSIAPLRKSHLVRISFEANDRHLAAQVANTLALVYIENDLDSRMQMTGMATSWLTERLSVLKTNLKDSEEKLQAYREREKLVDIDGAVTTITAQQLSDLGSKLALAKQDSAVALAALSQIRSLRDKSIGSLMSLPVVLEDSLVSSLSEEESTASRQLQSLAKRYGQKHPKMQQAKAALADAQKAIKRRVDQVISGIEKEYQVARAKERSLKTSINSTKGEMQVINRKGYQLGVLEREVESNRQIYELFLNRFKETNETSGLEKTHARESQTLPFQR